MLLLYSSLVRTYFRVRFGEPPDLSQGREGRGLVIVADGVGGLDLCGMGLRYVMGALNKKLLNIRFSLSRSFANN